MKILITGASGQLGTELSIILSDGMAELGPISEQYQEAEIVLYDLDELDITNEADVVRVVGGSDFDLIINCAAYTNVDLCEIEKGKAYEVNALGPKYLARAAVLSDAKFVHVSTDYVFSGDDSSERLESDEPSPKSVYGSTKLAGEQFIAQSAEKFFIVRSAWLYGYKGNNFVKTIIKLARENGSIKVVDDQLGNPTSANDLAYEILKIALTENYGIYHCTNMGVCSWFEFACEIVDGLGIECEKIPCSTNEFPRKACRPSFSSLKNARLESTIGNEMRPWKTALAEYLRNYSKTEA